MKLCSKGEQSKKSSDERNSQKKWKPSEVGCLIFCLWEIHEKRGDTIPSAQIKSPSRKSPNSSHFIPFYKSLQQLFLSLNRANNDESELSHYSEKRGKDIIYSKLQKQRSSLQKLQTLLEREDRLIASDFGKIDSVMKMYKGIDEFISVQIGMAEPTYSIEVLQIFRDFCIPKFLQVKLKDQFIFAD